MVETRLGNENCAHHDGEGDVFTWRRHAGHLHAWAGDNGLCARHGRLGEQHPHRRGCTRAQGAQEDEQGRDHDNGRETVWGQASDEVGFWVTFVSFSLIAILEDHGVNPQYLCWTQRRRNACTMNIFKDILDQRESTSQERSCPDIQILKSGTTSSIAPLTSALLRFLFFPPR